MSSLPSLEVSPSSSSVPSLSPPFFFSVFPSLSSSPFEPPPHEVSILLGRSFNFLSCLPFFSYSLSSLSFLTLLLFHYCGNPSHTLLPYLTLLPLLLSLHIFSCSLGPSISLFITTYRLSLVLGPRVSSLSSPPSVYLQRHRTPLPHSLLYSVTCMSGICY